MTRAHKFASSRAARRRRERNFPAAFVLSYRRCSLKKNFLYIFLFLSRPNGSIRLFRYSQWFYDSLIG